MDGNEYQKLAARTICDQEANPKRHICTYGSEPFIQLLHSVIGISGESGELSSAIEKHMWYGQELDWVNVYEELGDLLWYIAEACTALDVSMETIMETNIQKLRKRYPDKYSDYNAAEDNRNREAERSVLTKNTALTRCHGCGKVGRDVDEFTSPYTGLCVECTQKKGI